MPVNNISFLHNCEKSIFIFGSYRIFLTNMNYILLISKFHDRKVDFYTFIIFYVKYEVSCECKADSLKLNENMNVWSYTYLMSETFQTICIYHE